jgi:hypothetical protein
VSTPRACRVLRTIRSSVKKRFYRVYTEEGLALRCNVHGATSWRCIDSSDGPPRRAMTSGAWTLWPMRAPMGDGSGR